MGEQQAVVHTASDPLAVQVIPQNGTAIEPSSYGSRDQVKELTTRIMAMHPAARQIGERGCRLLAQLGIALNLNPLPGTGHIHAWIDDGQLCVHIGLEGRVALARADSPFSYNFRPMRAEEIEEHGVDLGAGDRGYITELYRHDVTREQKELGLPLMPVYGIGICRGKERLVKGRSHAWRARERSVKDAIKSAYSFSLPSDLVGAFRLADSEPEESLGEGESGAGRLPEGVEEGQVREVEQAPRTDPAMLYGEAETGTASRAWDPSGDDLSDNQAEAAPAPAGRAETAGPETAPGGEAGNGGNGEPASQPGRSTRGSAVRQSASIRCNAGAFNRLATEFARAHPRWQTPAGTPDRYHILASLYAENYKVITDATLEPAFEALARRAAEKESAGGQLG